MGGAVLRWFRLSFGQSSIDRRRYEVSWPPFSRGMHILPYVLHLSQPLSTSLSPRNHFDSLPTLHFCRFILTRSLCLLLLHHTLRSACSPPRCAPPPPHFALPPPAPASLRSLIRLSPLPLHLNPCLLPQVRREKATYHTLNKLSVDVTRKVLVAEAWVPVAAKGRVRVSELSCRKYCLMSCLWIMHCVVCLLCACLVCRRSGRPCACMHQDKSCLPGEVAAGMGCGLLPRPPLDPTQQLTAPTHRPTHPHATSITNLNIPFCTTRTQLLSPSNPALPPPFSALPPTTHSPSLTHAGRLAPCRPACRLSHGHSVPAHDHLRAAPHLPPDLQVHLRLSRHCGCVWWVGNEEGCDCGSLCGCVS